MKTGGILWLLMPLLLVAFADLGWADQAPGVDLTKVLPDVLSWIGPAPTPAPAQPLLKSGDQLAFMGDSILQFGELYTRGPGRFPDLLSATEVELRHHGGRRAGHQ